MFIWLLVTLLLGIVCQDEVVACSFNQLHNCEGYSQLTESRIILPRAEEIDTKCDEYAELFECVTAYQGDCELKDRILWQSIHVQITQLCSVSREAYVTNEYCWSEELESEIDYCNMDVQDELKDSSITPCRAFETFVNCCRIATEDLCDKASSLVMQDLANAYTLMSRDFFNCTNNKPTTSTTTTESSTTTSPSTSTTASTTKANTTLFKATTIDQGKEVNEDNTHLATSTDLNRVTVELKSWSSEKDSIFETRPLTAGSTRLASSIYSVAFCLRCLL